MTQSSKLPLAAVALAGLCALGLLYWWLAQTPEHEGVTLRADAGAAHSPPTDSRGAAALPASAASGNDTADRMEVDVARYFDLGYAGGLVVDQHLRSKLEAAVGTLPDNPSAADLAKLEFQLRQGLPKEDAEKAIKLVHSYRGFSKDMRDEMVRTAIPQTQEQAIAVVDNMVAVQRRHFDEATVQAMFGAQNALARITVQAGIITQDPALSYAEKKTRLDTLRAQLTAEQRELIPELPAEPDSPKGP